MQKLFTASQIKAWDNYTIKNEPISSIHLMERAAIAFKNWFITEFSSTQKVHIFCGPRNNGGDGLAICRLLLQKGFQVTPYLINPENKFSVDCYQNYQKLAHVNVITNTSQLTIENINENDIVIDAIFGSGLSRPITGIYKTIIDTLNAITCNKIAVDVPSGMYSDSLNLTPNTVFNTDIIATFQTMKRSFFFKENKENFKNIIVLDIGLSDTFYKNTKCNWHTIDKISEIPKHDKLKNKSYSLEDFVELRLPIYNTINAIKKSLKAAYKQRKNIRFNLLHNYIASPGNNIYILLNQ